MPAKTKSQKVNELYQAYPRKVGTAAAKRAIERALKRESFSVLMEKVVAFAGRMEPFRGTDKWQFVPHPSTWFNQDRWQDEEDGLFLVKKDESVTAQFNVPTKHQQDELMESRRRELDEAEQQRRESVQFCEQWIVRDKFGYVSARADFLRDAHALLAEKCRKDEEFFRWCIWDKYGRNRDA